MRTAILVLPRTYNDGSAIAFYHTALELDLLKNFGGFSVSDKQGKWEDSDTRRVYSETCAHYEIAADWTPERAATLRALAAYYCAAAEQITVFLTIDGDSEFVAPDIAARDSLLAMQAQKLAA